MTKFCHYFMINLFIISGIYSFDVPFLDSRLVGESNHKTSLSKWRGTKSSVFKENPFKKRSLDHGTKNHVRRTMDYIKNSFSPENFFVNSNDEIYDNRIERYVRSKGNLDETDCQWEQTTDEPEEIMQERRKKETKKKQKKRYLDYTNSQMPFNEGIKSKTTQANKAVTKNTRRRSSRSRLKLPENFEDLEDELPEEYSRVRRFLDHERAKKRIRSPTTLEIKEAAMSRVLDPNFNLDGILEPHVRKRREQHLNPSFRRRRKAKIRLKRF